jgi:predicted DNA-binding transcriptional regulator YafY
MMKKSWVMGDTAGRMLELLSLLQSRRGWAGHELADRLEVSERTLRRDIERLRQLGYPVEATRGRDGSYTLGRGGRMPPLLLNDEEAAAVAIGLSAASDGTVAGMEEAAAQALAKLDQLLPAQVAVRVRALHEQTDSLARPCRARNKLSARQLLTLAHACSANERVRFRYTDRNDQHSHRLVEPLRVVRSGPLWYLIARDVDRRAWRTFRLDRMSSVESVGTRFTLEEAPDPVAMLGEGLARLSAPFRATIRLPVPIDEVAQIMSRTFALVDDEGSATVIEVGAPNLARMVSYLAGVSPSCEVLEPPALREALRQHARRVAAANR